MRSDSSAASRYALSFTTGALLVREAVVAVPLYREIRDWAAVRELIRASNLLQARTVSSGIRLAREVAQRLAVLSDDELDLLLEISATERGYLMWAAACRRYAFIGEFAEEVLRERFLLLAPKITYDEFDGFVRGKALWHPELEELKDSTLRKLRAVIFRMLVEAGLITDQGEIVPTVLSGRLLNALEIGEPSDLRFFPTIIRGAR